MRKEPNNISAGELRRAFPKIALDLETQVLVHEAESLKLNVRVARGGRTSILRVQLTHSHTLRISPVDRGSQGVGEFFTFYGNPDKPNEMRQTIRAFIEVTEDSETDKPVVQESFTVQGDNLEEVINASLSVFFSITGHKLQPVLQGRR